jgi:hypothetical protein
MFIVDKPETFAAPEEQNVAETGAEHFAPLELSCFGRGTAINIRLLRSCEPSVAWPALTTTSLRLDR